MDQMDQIDQMTDQSPVGASAPAGTTNPSNPADFSPAITAAAYADSLHDQAAKTSPITNQDIYFTGSGKEYFRIWIVNLCLTIATFGIYSAWAKVRRLQYFDRNTQLSGAVFNFHGDPVAILRGRLIAVVLLFAYHYVFQLSKTIGILVVACMLLGMPMMLRSAQRFRLRNTSYRGLRFNFFGSMTGAYLTYLPVVTVFLLPGLIGALYPHRPLWISVSLLGYLTWPWLHANMKRYQHGNFSYGTLQSDCTLKRSAFISTYVVAGFFMLGVAVVVGIASGVGVAIYQHIIASNADPLLRSQFFVTALVAIAALLFAYFAYLVCGPFVQATIWNKVWSSTSLTELTINSAVPRWKYLKLQSVNVILTLLTLGLYRPFAVVRAYQFRLKHVQIAGPGFNAIQSGTGVASSSAAGDSSADFLGFDLSW